MTNKTETKELVIGYMGVHNSFSEKASKKLIEKNNLAADTKITLLSLVNAYHVRDALLQKQIDLGVVAFKNSTTGTVVETAEAFKELEIEILDELSIPIHQCLFKLPGTLNDAITSVASHTQALMQTKNNRRQLFGDREMKEIILEDTSLSARMLAEGKLSADTAVVCSMDAGQNNALELIKENIEDMPDNRTYFRLFRLKEHL